MIRNHFFIFFKSLDKKYFIAFLIMMFVPLTSFIFLSSPTKSKTKKTPDIAELLSNIAQCGTNLNSSDQLNYTLAETISWTTVAPQPVGNAEGQGVVVNGKLYVFGGFDSKKGCCTPTSRAWVFDPVADTWAAIANMPAMNGTGHGGVTHSGFTTDGTDIYFASGYTSNGSGTGQIFGTKEAWRYNVSTNTYTKLPNMPVDISAGQLEYLNGQLHYIGGTNKARTIDLNTHYVLDLNNLGAGWKTLAPIANGRHHAASAVLNGKIYFIGGQHKHDGNLVTQADVECYDPATNKWTRVADLPRGRGHISQSCFALNGKIFVIGGEINHSDHVNDVTVYDPVTNQWEYWTPLPVSRASGISRPINGLIYYTSGSWQTTTFRGQVGGAVILPNTVRINTGGPVVGVGDVSWDACRTNACVYASAGFSSTKSNTITGFSAPISQRILQSEWTKSGGTAGSLAFTFRIPIQNGNYTVRLHFVELTKFSQGLRVFDVNIEGGSKELVNFDIYKEANGANKAIFRDFPVTVSDEEIAIDFIKQVENPKISAIEILPQLSPDTQPPSPPVLSLVSKTHQSVSLSWTNSTDNVGVTGYNIYQNNNLLTTISETSFTVNNLSPNTAYQFTVKAKDAAGNLSSASNTINVTTDDAPSSSFTLYEAEDHYVPIIDVGTNAISPTNGGNGSGQSNEMSVSLFDKGDKLRINFNISEAGQYILKVRLRSGNSSNSTGFWSNDVFSLNNSLINFTGDQSSVSNLLGAYGGAYFGTMNSNTLILGVGNRYLDIEATRGYLVVDYLEIEKIGGSSDTEAPSAPVLTLGSKTNTTVSLNWSGSSDNVGVTGYAVYKGAVLEAEVSANNYTVTGLAANTAYTFTVKAKDAAGNLSVASNTLNVTTDPNPVSSVVMYEAEEHYVVLTDVGSSDIGPVNGGNGTGQSNELSASLFDKGDKLRINFNISESGQYILRVRVRSGNSSNSTGFLNTYLYQIDGTSAGFTLDASSISSLLNSYGSAYFATVESDIQTLSIGNHFINIQVNRGSLAVDYMEVVRISSPSAKAGDLKLSTDKSKEKVEIKEIYPNPTVDNALTIRFSRGIEGKVGFSFVNYQGQVIANHQEQMEGQDKVELNVRSLNSGVYILMVQTENLVSKPLKIIKQ